jgi:glycosyltransferase involved in cell wall biosynthesis
LLRLGEIIRQNDIQLVHLNNQLVSNFYGVMLAKQHRLPCLVHLRTFNSHGMNPYKAHYAAVPNIRFCAISNALKDHWAGQGIAPSQIEVLHNALEIQREDCTFAESPPAAWAQAKRRLLFVGRLIPCKGLPNLFSALSKMKTQPTLFLVGDGPETPMLLGLRDKLGLIDRIVFLGYQKNPFPFIERADALVLPSSEEGLGRSLMEAMALGTPVVGTRIGGIPDVITHEENGLLVEYGDIDALALACDRVLDPAYGARLAAAGKKTSEERFSLSRYSAQLAHIYDQLLTTDGRYSENHRPKVSVRQNSGL